MRCFSETQSIAVVLSLACFGCSALYDADDFGACSVPAPAVFPEPPCSTATGTCLSTCTTDEACAACYDANGDGEFSEPEVDCYICVVTDFYICVADSGCAREIEAINCCTDALCGQLGCPVVENPCQNETDALDTCAVANVGAACNDSILGCFGL